MKRFLQRWPWLVTLFILLLILGVAASRLADPKPVPLLPCPAHFRMTAPPNPHCVPGSVP